MKLLSNLSKLLTESIKHPLTNSVIGQNHSEVVELSNVGEQFFGSGLSEEGTKVQPPIIVTRNYKVTLLAVFILTIIFLAISFYLSSVVQPSPLQLRLFGDCETVSKLGAGAIIGMLGGKVS